jgi:hypothetical protein
VVLWNCLDGLVVRVCPPLLLLLPQPATSAPMATAGIRMCLIGLPLIGQHSS